MKYQHQAKLIKLQDELIQMQRERINLDNNIRQFDTLIVEKTNEILELKKEATASGRKK